MIANIECLQEYYIAKLKVTITFLMKSYPVNLSMCHISKFSHQYYFDHAFLKLLMVYIRSIGDLKLGMAH